jgi:hypothetical protein
MTLYVILNFINPADVTLTLINPSPNFTINLNNWFRFWLIQTIRRNLYFEYQICGNLTPTTNCDTAIVTIKKN